MWRVWGRRKICKGFWLGNLKEREQFVDLAVYGKVILKLVLREVDRRIWTGFICLRVGTSRGLL
jgi:hypothetical protein